MGVVRASTSLGLYPARRNPRNQGKCAEGIGQAPLYRYYGGRRVVLYPAGTPAFADYLRHCVPRNTVPNGGNNAMPAVTR
jgi:hypothetical protein